MYGGNVELLRRDVSLWRDEVQDDVLRDGRLHGGRVLLRDNVPREEG
jgi:hypothetical protein